MAKVATTSLGKSNNYRDDQDGLDDDIFFSFCTFLFVCDDDNGHLVDAEAPRSRPRVSCPPPPAAALSPTFETFTFYILTPTFETFTFYILTATFETFTLYNL